MGMLSGSALLHAADDEARMVADKIAEEHGISNWGAVSHVKFSFVATLPGADEPLKRSWIWSPKTGEVELVDSDYTYNNQSLKEADRKTDAMFINDSFWLLFPFHLVWDKGVVLTLSEGPKEAPVSGKPLRMLTVQYPREGGYTPGDAYDVYFDENHRVAEWAYRKGGEGEPKVVSTWEDYKDLGGVTIATDHKGPKGFRIEIKDLEIR